MWQELLEQCMPALISIVTVLISGLVSFLTFKINAYLKKLKDKSDSELTKTIIDNVVAYVDQKLTDATNEEKFDTAAEKAAEWLQAKGISVSDAELEILIEAAVNAAHKGWTGDLEVPILENTTVEELPEATEINQ